MKKLDLDMTVGDAILKEMEHCGDDDPEHFLRLVKQYNEMTEQDPDPESEVRRGPEGFDFTRPEVY